MIQPSNDPICSSLVGPQIRRRYAVERRWMFRKISCTVKDGYGLLQATSAERNAARNTEGRRPRRAERNINIVRGRPRDFKRRPKLR